MFHFSINSITIFQATSSRLRKVLQPGEYKFEGGIGEGFFCKRYQRMCYCRYERKW